MQLLGLTLGMRVTFIVYEDRGTHPEQSVPIPKRKNRFSGFPVCNFYIQLYPVAPFYQIITNCYFDSFYIVDMIFLSHPNSRNYWPSVLKHWKSNVTFIYLSEFGLSVP